MKPGWLLRLRLGFLALALLASALHAATDSNLRNHARSDLGGSLERLDKNERVAAYEWPQEPEIVALYFGADWCAPCHVFLPKLRAVYDQLRAAGADTEIVFVSLDRSATEMRRYMTQAKMPWPAVAWHRREQLPAVQALAGKAPPNLVLLDRAGRVLASAWDGDTYTGPTSVLAVWLKHFMPHAENSTHASASSPSAPFSRKAPASK